MKGSPAMVTIDFGMVAVRGRSLVARPPARIATAGMAAGNASLDKYAFIGHQFFEGSLHCLTAVHCRHPSQGPDACCIEPDDRDIASPAAVSAGVDEVRALVETHG